MTMPDYIIPLSHVVDVVRDPIVDLNGERYLVVAHAWTQTELTMIEEDDNAFGYGLVRIDAITGKCLPQEYAPPPTRH